MYVHCKAMFCAFLYCKFQYILLKRHFKHKSQHTFLSFGIKFSNHLEFSLAIGI